MRFISTRGGSPAIGFREAVLSGLAPDGGLYMPATWPKISEPDRSRFTEIGFAEVAASILARFSNGELSERDLLPMATRAFAAFDASNVAPLRRLDADTHLLELFHGPTLAFKDVAMRMLAELYGWALEGAPRGKTILGATSGDTGAAAISAFAGSERVELFMLHPKGRISNVQRRMMTTVEAANVVNLAVDGTFDDCQRVVKSLLADDRLNRALDLGAVNSINFIRLAAQTVYYFTATAALGMPATFVVPTGNFGDAFAGYAASVMGLPVVRLVAAVNRNDIIKRALMEGLYEPAAVHATSSPSMDIQSASNFERLLFEAGGRDTAFVAGRMTTLQRDGRLALPDEMGTRIAKAFSSESATDEEVDEMMALVHEEHDILVDPHTAVALVALDKVRKEGRIDGPAICLATAHPGKFPDAVRRATGVDPVLPPRYSDLMERTERIIEAPADVATMRTIVETNSRFIAKGSKP